MPGQNRPAAASAGTATGPRTITTAEAAPGRALAFWQDLTSDTFVPLAAAPTTEDPFQGRIVHLARV